jgi:hypothetical protein
MDTQRINSETELNVFARFFGAILVDLKHHNLRLKVQPDSQPSYIQESSIEFVEHVR